MRFAQLVKLIFISCTLVSCWATASVPLKKSYVHYDYQQGDFALKQGNTATAIYVDSQDLSGVSLAVQSLQSDIQKVTGIKPQLINEPSGQSALVIIGTVGHSQLIDQLIASGKLDVSAIKGQWEAFHIQQVTNPFPGVEKALVVAGSDRRGTIFGVYDISEQIGVSPWYWWADVAIKPQSQLFIAADVNVTEQPKVKYRGIFLNDEAPALTGWVKEKYGDYNAEFYQHVFELLLRLKANFLWPAMWNNAFSMDDVNNPKLAHEMGIVMSTSHHEPMMRADKEWDRVGKGKWDYAVNPDNLYQFWQQGAERHKNLDSIFTLGMRGQADTPMSETENIGLLEKIVHDQREILKNTFSDRDISDVPQVWTLYKEVQSYYENGMRVPDDVTLLWSDDNWGNIRRLPTEKERLRQGGAGVYYHFDYVGGPRSYRWINTTQVSKVWEQMKLAYQYGADRIWVVNVGDLKPMELPTDFFLRLAWNPDAVAQQQLSQYSQQWARQQFSETHAAEIARIVDGYTRHNANRKPELLDENTYSILHYLEAKGVSDELQSLAASAENIYQQLNDEDKAAFFQLVLHPVQASQAVFELYHNVAINRLYAKQGRASTNQFAEQTKQWFEKDAELTKRYHELENGRWDHFMDQTHIGYTHWNNPPANSMPYVAMNQPQAVADMGVAVEGTEASWPAQGRLTLDAFSPYGQQQRFIDVFNKGTKGFAFSASANQPWIKISKTSGQVTIEQRLWVSIDWQKAPAGELAGQINIKGTGWGGAVINVTAVKPQSTDVNGFVEADGYISLDVSKANMLNNSKDVSWQLIPNYGREKASVTSVTPANTSIEDLTNTPVLEYDFTLFTTGDLTVHTQVAPTLNFVPERGLRYAIAVDDKTPQIVDILAKNTHADWQQAVSNNIRDIVSQHQVMETGHHKLRIYLIDPAVVIEKIIINTGGLKPSYLGPQASKYIAASSATSMEK
ncbi:glycosyl hydrolase 115 family protein [Neptunicella marina]|uniref:Glycosyl hydrolase 115 family protein n=1 Tax=Neptunicella marina TaxID=2125989 RepID=A0A8J6M1G6_9ALTE|nr:glycosyl hydrolase 115 family protein [Neptunicella marina]MBC3765427.1 glycosyl hydrolase 115 family protein [Neptunicella marina]